MVREARIFNPHITNRLKAGIEFGLTEGTTNR
jgi:hypothetical protein